MTDKPIIAFDLSVAVWAHNHRLLTTFKLDPAATSLFFNPPSPIQRVSALLDRAFETMDRRKFRRARRILRANGNDSHAAWSLLYQRAQTRYFRNRFLQPMADLLCVDFTKGLGETYQPGRGMIITDEVDNYKDGE